MSTIGVKAIKYPDGDSAIDITDGGNVTLAGTLGVTGAVTANAGVVVDNITIDGTEIDLSSGDLTLDVAGDIILDADGGDVKINDGGSARFHILTSATQTQLFNQQQDADIVFKGDDGGSVITALTLDMSDAGKATFNSEVRFTSATINSQVSIYTDGSGAEIDNTSGNFTIDTAGTIILDADSGSINLLDGGTTHAELINSSNDFVIKSSQSDKDMIFNGVDGGSLITALTLDMSDAGTATFNNRIRGASSSEGSPTYSFGTDTNTGMFSPSADIIGLSSAGTERYRFSYNSLSLMDPNLANSRFNISSDIGIYTGMSMKTTTNRDNSYFIAFFNASTTLIGGVTQNGTSNVTFETSSDYRLKENVNYNFDATTRLKQLKPCRFNFIADGPDKVFDGFLAHEVSSIVPQAVTREKDATRDIGTIKDEDSNVLKTDAPEVQKENNQTWEKTGTENVYQGIDHSKLVPLLTKTLQEALTRIDTLEAEVKALKG